MKKYCLVILLFCNACVTSTLLYTDINGGTVYEAQCDGGLYTLGDCYRKASEDCPFGFDVKDKVSSEWVGSRKLIYACKQANIRNGYRQY